MDNPEHHGLFFIFGLFSYIWASGKSPEAVPSSVHTNLLIRIDPRHPETLILGILPKMNAYETDMGQGLGPAGAHGPGRTLVRARAQGPGRTLAQGPGRTRAQFLFASVSGVLNLYFSKDN